MVRTRVAAVLAGLSLATSAGLIATSGPALATTPRATGATGATTPAVPKLSHIMEVFLENETATQTFENPTLEPSLAALVKQGSYVPNFYGSGHASLDNYIADFSAEQPDADTEGDCAGMAPNSGCIFPATVPTLATTLDAAGDSWKVYAQGMATAGLMTGQTDGCVHSPDLSLPDIYQGPGTNGYATRHNPPEWFDSILTKGGSEAYCQAHDVDLTQLATDEQSTSTLPKWSFVEPDTCNDGHDNQTGTSGGCSGDPEGPTAPSGTAAIDAWLPGFVKSVMSSPGWDANSVMVITFDESLTTGVDSASGCTPCNDTSAGGRIGALFLGDPVKKDFSSTWQGDHYGLLRTIEASYGLPTLKSLAVSPAAAATVHDGDPGVTPVTDIWAASTGTPAVATTTTSTTTTTTATKAATKTKIATTSHKATRKSATSAVAQPSSTLAYTGLPVALGVIAFGLLAFGLGGSRLLRRRS